MSWSVSAWGRPAAVAAKVAQDMDRIKCAEPEESIKNNIKAAIVTACEHMPIDSAVRVEANGSQYVQGERATNSAVMKIEPLYGFVE